MNIIRINDYNEIHTDQDIFELVSLCLFNPSLGKVTSLAQSLYSKKESVFYKAVLEDEVIGIIGGNIVNGNKLELLHIAVKKDHRLQGKSKIMLQSIIELEGIKQVYCEVDHKIEKYFKSIGFTTTLIEDEFLGSETFLCKLNC